MHVGPYLFGQSVDCNAPVVAKRLFSVAEVVVALEIVGALGIGHLRAQTVDPQHRKHNEARAADAPKNIPYRDARAEQLEKVIGFVDPQSQEGESGDHACAPADKAVPNCLGAAFHHLFLVADSPVDQNAYDAQEVP